MTDPVTLFKRELDRLAKWGEGAKFRGVVVSQDFWPQIAGQVRDNMIHRTTREGNQNVTYAWWCLQSATYPFAFTSGQPFFFIHQTREQYERDWLNRETELLDDIHARLHQHGPLRTRQFDHVTIQEGHPLRGDLGVDFGIHDHRNLSSVDYDEMAAALEMERQKQSPDYRRVLSRFNYNQLVNNRPQSRWTGTLEFDKEDVIRRVHLTRCRRFILYDHSNLRPEDLGKLFLLRSGYGYAGPYQIVGIARGPNGRLRMIPFLNKPTTKRAGFIRYALKWFSPEELFVYLYPAPIGTRAMLEELRAMAVSPTYWGAIDHERMGIFDEGFVSSCRCGRRQDYHQISVSFEDTRGREMRRVVARGTDELMWATTRTLYVS